MALNKAIRSGKEHRRLWSGKDKSKNIDGACRNHGSCKYCKCNRLYQFRKETQRANVHLKEYEKETEE